MTLKSDPKIREKLTCGFKYNMRNLVEFHPITQKSETFFLRCSFGSKCTRFELQNTEELSFMTMNSDTKFE